MRKNDLPENLFCCLMLIAALSMISCSQRYHTKTDGEKEREKALQNGIKKISVVHISFLAGMKQVEQPFNEKYFNKEGFKTRETNYGFNGEVVCQISYKYSPAGNLTLTTGLNPDSSLLFRETISYDEQDNGKELYSYLPDGTYKYRNAASFDEKGRMIQLAWYWPDGLKAINKYVYDRDKKTEDVEYDPDGHFNYRWQYHYDRKGNLIQAVQFYPNKKINAKISYQYHGYDLISQINYSGESVQSKIVLEYDTKHLLTKKNEYSRTGSISSSFTYHYEFY